MPLAFSIASLIFRVGSSKSIAGSSNCAARLGSSRNARKVSATELESDCRLYPPSRKKTQRPPTAAELLCQLLDARCQHIERARCELQPSQGVQCMRIVPEKDMSSFGLAYMTPMRISSRASTQWVCGTKGMRIFSIFRFRTVCLAGLKLALWKEDLTQLKQGLYQA